MRHVSPNANRSNGDSTANSSAAGTGAGGSASSLTSTVFSVRAFIFEGLKLIDGGESCKPNRTAGGGGRSASYAESLLRVSHARPPPPAVLFLVYREVLRLLVVDDDGGGGLLGDELELFAQLDADALGREQLEELRLVFEVGARRVAEAEARALVALVEEFREFRRVAFGDAQLFADALVPEFRERLGRLDREAVEVQIVGVVVRAEKLLRVLARAPPYGDELERDHVNAPR